jgi:hypothetical protein
MPLDMYIDKLEYFTFSCFDCSLEQIEHFLQFKFGICNKYKIHYISFKFDLYESKPFKGGAHFEKAYFFVPKNHKNRCVMFSNYSDGLSSLVYQITFELGITAYNFRVTTIQGSDALNSFSCIKNGDEIRTVSAMKDPQWVFYNQGEIQWFENNELYKSKIIKTRLNKDIIISYCAKLGFDITNDEFWESDQSLLLERLQW